MCSPLVLLLWWRFTFSARRVLAVPFFSMRLLQMEVAFQIVSNTL
jgi:hypothetical protein